MNEDEAPSPYPHARATIVDGQVTIVEWDPRLLRTQFLSSCRGNPQAIYADLRFFGDPEVREVVISNDVPGAIDEGAKAVFTRWASQVGVVRIYFPDEFVELQPAFDAGLEAVVTCPICRHRIEAGGLEFWIGVKRCGVTPTRCSSCGSAIPQMQVAEDSLSGRES